MILPFFYNNREEFCPGTEFHKRVLNTKEFCGTALKKKIFQRGDYTNLCELIVMGHVPDFQLHQPEAHHQALFMVDCLYLLTIQLGNC